ncbi:MAG TPA: sigma-54 dependent transcriptional regulator [Thermoanaerobaculia bacterium]|nr:sigma-54 dependent transcriptional regulator [Thermoanaerobaculia bacterium]
MSGSPARDSPTAAGAGATILLVDDEEYVRDSTAELLERRGYTVRTARSGAEALTPELIDGVEALITDLKMPGMDGGDLVAAAAERDPGLPILVLTAHGTVSSAVECLRRGAVDYLLKPVDPDSLTYAIERAIGEAARRRELAYLRELRDPAYEAPLGRSAAWAELMALAQRVAPSDSSALLIGESGTGKEEVARFLHRLSARHDRPLVVVNCAAIPTELFESELFGHRRGAFTGAVADREGRFHVAHRGTLVLDEVNSLSLVSQAKLLRVLQDGAFERVGDSRPTQVDVRLVCASNADLGAEVEAGRFRADLYYRINVVTLELPPLRSRREDIGLLAEAFVAQVGRQLDRPMRGITGRALSALEAYDWPGNVRELRNVVERGVLLSRSDWLDADVLPFAGSHLEEGDDQASLDLRERLRAVERQTLRLALERAAGVRREAARLLAIDERNLAYYLRKHDLMDWRPEESER